MADFYFAVWQKSCNFAPSLIIIIDYNYGVQ